MDVSGVNTFSTAVEGLKRAQTAVDQTAQNIASGSLDPEDVVSLSAASASFKANAAVLKTDDQMNKTLLDIKA